MSKKGGGIKGRLHPIKKAKVLAKSAGLCFYCGNPFNERKYVTKLSFDHVIPRTLGGTERIENLVAACRGCNGKKGDLSMDEFREVCGGFWAEILGLKADAHPTYDNPLVPFCATMTYCIDGGKNQRIIREYEQKSKQGALQTDYDEELRCLLLLWASVHKKPHGHVRPCCAKSESGSYVS